MDGPAVAIRRARLSNADGYTRERLVHALGGVSLAAAGVPPRATLIVRRLVMTTPLPRRGNPDVFAATLRDALRERVVTARRSSDGNDDADILFEDDAALEAAIVVDWLDFATSITRAWWVAVVGPAPPLERWRRVVLHDVRILPRIVARLIASGHAARWLARFEGGELRAAADRMLAQAGAAPLESSVIGQIEPPDRIVRQPSARASPATVSPILDVVREAHEFASSEARVFVVVALALARRPALVATRRFAEAITRLGENVPTPPLRQQPRERRTAADAFGAASSPKKAQVPCKPLAQVATGQLAAVTDPVLPLAAPFAMPDADNSGVPHRPTPRHNLHSAAERTEPHPDTPTASTIVETEFGGIFFLLNAFAALGLYGDFTRPADGLRGLSPFELIDLLATRWFGAAFLADPLAGLLHELSGLTPRQRAGQDFEAPVWVVQDSWLAPWPVATPVRRGSARWHPAGFPVADDSAAPLSPAWQRRRWVTCLARYLEARLKVTLDSDDAVALTCRLPAKIVHDGDTVEVGFALDRHPIALRIAGLDRNPGWVPAAGRSIGFVFA